LCIDGARHKVGDKVFSITRDKCYVERGIVEVISLAIGCTDHDLHGAATATLADLSALGGLTDDAELVMMAMDVETPSEI
jgi:hypothetical protein